MSRNNDETPLTQEEVEARGASFDIVEPLLDAMYSEIAILSAKKQDAVANNNKIKTANRLLVDALSILEGEPTRQYLEIFDPDDMPQYSDIVLMLGQFQTALVVFKQKYYADRQWMAIYDENDDEEEEEEDS